MVKEITDYNIINEFINQPSVRPYVAFGNNEIDASDLFIKDVTFLGYFHDDTLLGLGVVEHHLPTTHEAHIYFNKKGRRFTRIGGKELLELVKALYGGGFIFGKTPSDNTVAKKYSESFGFIYVKQEYSPRTPGIKFDWCYLRR